METNIKNDCDKYFNKQYMIFLQTYRNINERIKNRRRGAIMLTKEQWDNLRYILGRFDKEIY